MRAVTCRDGQVAVIDTPPPVATDDDHVIVDVTDAGICGSDLHLVAAGLRGVILGHEFGGRLADGTLVAVRPTGECGTCSSCRADRHHLCHDATMRFHGATLPGGLAEQVLVHRSRLVPMPAGMSDGVVGLVEPTAIAVHGVARSGVRPGDRALVVGAGSIGLLTVAVLRHRGIDVDLLARHQHQREVGVAFGAHVAAAEAASATDGADYDVVFDAAATQQALDEAVQRCRPGGTLLEYGLFWSPVTLDNRILYKEISLVPTMFSAHGHDGDDFAEAAAVLAAAPLVGELLITHRSPLSAAAEAFATAADRHAGAIKVHLHP